MKPRDFVLEQLRHRETKPVPYTLSFEGSVETQLNEYYGAERWRERLIPYMATVGGLDTIQETRVSDTHFRDAFGGLWRDDRRPWHLVEPSLKTPSFDGFTFPSP